MVVSMEKKKGGLQNMNRRLIIFTVLASFLGTVANGYPDILNSPQDIIEPFINESLYIHYGLVLSESELSMVWSLLSCLLDFGAVFGALLMPILAERFGRNATSLVINQLITVVGAFLQAMALPTFCCELLFIGRFIIGFAVSICGLMPIYLSECAPDYCRGFIGAVSAWFYYSWRSILKAVGLPGMLGTPCCWSYLLAIGIIPASITLILSRFIPESPKYLFITKHDEEASTRSLKFYQGEDANINGAIEEFCHEEHLARDQPEVSLAVIFQEAHLRRAFYVGVLALVALDAPGSDAIGQYSTTLFESIGISGKDAAIFSVLLGLPALALALPTLPFIERWGRRPLLLSAMFLGGLTDVMIVVGGATGRAMVCVIGMVIIQILMRVSISPIGHFLTAEVCPQASRSKTASIGLACNWSCSCLIILFYPTLHSTIGWYAFIPFALFCFALFAWFWIYLPETKNRPVDEIVEQWVTLGLTSDKLNKPVGEESELSYLLDPRNREYHKYD